MPSPLGHAIAGYTAAVALEPKDPSRHGSMALRITCVLLAMSPDLDLLVPGQHRTFSHSFLAVTAVAGVAWVATMLEPRAVRWRLVLASALAYGSHLLLDFFGVDAGIPSGLQLFWPWVDQWFRYDHPIFSATERHDVLSWESMLVNLVAAVREVAILLPICLGLSWMRRRPARLGPKAG
jgi:hypothetical protein